MAFFPFYIEDRQPRSCARHHRPSHIGEQHFGLGLTPEDFLTTIIALPQRQGPYNRSWKNMQAAKLDAGSTITKEKDKFQVNIDVQHFAPEEISVKTADGFLVIEAHHEEREDEHGFVSRGFSRRYPLPEGIESDHVFSKLSSDGVLTITAPLKPSPKASNERIVPIIQTGPVRKQVDGGVKEVKEKEKTEQE